MRLPFLAVWAAAIMTFAGAAFAADLDFTLKNGTGYQIDKIYISRHSASRWGGDVIGKGNVLDDGDSTEVTFRERVRGCHWDLKVMYHDETTAEWSNLNLCEISKVTLHYDRKSEVTRASFE